MSQRIGEQRSAGFWPLAMVFALFVVFLYGPMITIFVLSFQGPEGGHFRVKGREVQDLPGCNGVLQRLDVGGDANGRGVDGRGDGVELGLV
jgi:hypothetical protein